MIRGFGRAQPVTEIPTLGPAGLGLLLLLIGAAAPRLSSGTPVPAGIGLSEASVSRRMPTCADPPAPGSDQNRPIELQRHGGRPSNGRQAESPGR